MNFLKILRVLFLKNISKRLVLEYARIVAHKMKFLLKISVVNVNKSWIPPCLLKSSLTEKFIFFVSCIYIFQYSLSK